MIKPKKIQEQLKERYQIAVGEISLDKLCSKLSDYSKEIVKIEGRSYVSGRRKKLKLKVIDLIKT